MKTFRLDCANCKTQLSYPLPEPSSYSFCPSCGTDMHVEVFPALLRPAAPGKSGETLLLDDESSCFYHPNKKAVIPCDGCGRFLCSLCDIGFDNQHLCSACVESGVKKGKLEHVKNEFTHYDEIALALAVYPLIVFYITLFTAPVALYFAFAYWKTPQSAAPRGRWRFVLAILIAGTQIVGWTVGLVFLIS